MSGITGWLGRNFIIRYYNYSKIHHFSEGDQVYLRQKMFTDTSFKAVSTYRLARPINSNDIDELNIDEAKKNLLKQNLDNTSLLKIVSSDKAL